MTIPYIKNNKLSPTDIEQFNFNDFTGGLNNRSTPMTLKDNEAQDISNMSFIADGSVEKRWGTELYDAIEMATAVTYTDVYRPIDSAEVIIRATATKVYAGAVLIATVTGQIQGVNYIGNYYFVDGTNMYVYDGTKVYTIKEPTHAYLASGAAGGTAVITIAVWDSRIAVGDFIQLEGINGTETGEIDSIDESALTVTFTANTTLAFLADELIRFYIPLNDTYYTGVSQSDETLNIKWYEPCANELDDAYKGECYIPVNCVCIQYDSQRLYVAGDPDHPNEIYIGDINNPYYFPVALGMQCSPNGDVIKDLIQFDDAIVVGRTDDIYAIYGETNDYTLANTFVIKKLDTHTGFVSINNARLGHNYMFFVGSDMNVYAMSTPRGDSETLSTTIVNKDKIILSEAPISLTNADIANSPAIFFEDEYIFIADDKLIVYNYIYRAWTIYEDLLPTYMVIKDNELLIGTSDGFIIERSTTYSDRGVAITASYKSGQYSLGSPINFKDFMDVYLVTYAYDDYDSSVTLSNLIDYYETKSTSDVDTLLSRFGTAVFGDLLISNNVAQSDNIPINIRGRTYTFLFGNKTVDEPMKVYQISGTYKVRGTR